MPRLCRDLFARIDELKNGNDFLVEVSVAEVRSEEVFDLLKPVDSSGNMAPPCPIKTMPSRLLRTRPVLPFLPRP